MKLLHQILLIVLVLTPISEAYAGQFLHADCGTTASAVPELAVNPHSQHASHGASHDPGPVDLEHSTMSDHDTSTSDCDCDCLCTAGHACQGGTGVPVSTAGYTPKRVRNIPIQLDAPLSSASLADDIRPPISPAR